MKFDLGGAAKAVLWLWLGSLIAAGLTILAQIVLARQLGPATFGIFAAALATAMMLVPLASFGIPGFWLRVFGQEGPSALRWLPASGKLVVASTSVVVMLLIAWASFIEGKSVERSVLVILSALAVGQLAVDLASAKIQLEGRYLALAAWQVFPSMVRLLSVLALCIAAKPVNVEAVAIAYALVALCFLILSAIHLVPLFKGRVNLVGRHGFVRYAEGLTPRIGAVARQSWVFAASSTLFMAYSQGPVVMLKHLVGPQEAGIYSVAFMILAAASLLPSVVYQKYLQPKVHRWIVHDPSRALEAYRLGRSLMLLSGLVVMLVVWGCAPWLIPLVFGAAYQDAVMPTCLLAICIPIRFCSSNQGGFMSSHALMKKKLGAMGFSVAVNISLAVLIVTRIGSYGVVVASIVAELVLLALLTIGIKQFSMTAKPNLETRNQ